MSNFSRDKFEESGRQWFVNHYECPCGHAWSDDWAATCDDDCPACGATCSPSSSDDVSAEHIEPGELTGRELATVLAALRYWQMELEEPDFEANGPHFADHAALTVEEIDDLCERLNAA